jgi:hypothetical protein
VSNYHKKNRVTPHMEPVQQLKEESLVACSARAEGRNSSLWKAVLGLGQNKGTAARSNRPLRRG